MNCYEFIAFVTRYYEDELSPRERAVMNDHLGECPECAAFLDSYRQTVKLQQLAAADDALPDDVPDKLVNAILAAAKAS